MGDVILTMKDIDKSFPGVHALDHVNFEVRRGEVHALMGENGAGKSTLMKVLTGIYQKDSGTITYKGQEIAFAISHICCFPTVRFFIFSFGLISMFRS